MLFPKPVIAPGWAVRVSPRCTVPVIVALASVGAANGCRAEASGAVPPVEPAMLLRE